MIPVVRALILSILLTFSLTAHAATVEVWLSSEDGEFQLTPGEAIPLEQDVRAQGTVVTIDPARTHQRMLGMGASFEHATCENLFKLTPEKREEVIRKLVDPVDGIGMNFMRVCIGTSDFVGEPYYSYCDLPEGETDPELTHFSIEKDRAYVLPVIKAAQAINPDLLFFASPWSPPGWMTSNGKLEGGRLLREWYDAYALYLVKFLRAYEAEGVPMRSITVQNEPAHVDPNYPTCLWRPEDQRDFLRDHLGPLFDQEGITTPVWCWDHNYKFEDFPRTVLSDPGAAKYCEGTAWHFYEGKPESMATIGAEFPGKDTFFTEGSTFFTRGAIKMIDIFRNGARSYNSWVVMLNEKRQPNRGPHFASPTCIEINSETNEVTYRFDYYMYGQFMKFIARDAVRLESTPGDGKFNSIAFQNPDGSIILVAANSAKTTGQFTVQVSGHAFRASLPSKSVGTYRWQLPAN
jgi:glucosylceramidase